MNVRAYVVDTNVVVAGLLTSDTSSPTARVLDGMVDVRFPYFLSPELLAEYREVLLRPKIQSRHGLTEEEIDTLLTEMVANAIVREPGASRHEAPTRQDQHLWDLLATEHGTVLITGDRELIDSPPAGTSVVSPASFIG